MRAKIAQEDLVEAGPVPFSVVRSTQFFEFVTGPALDRTVELAGPEPPGIDELVRRLVAVTGDPRTVVSDPHAGYLGAGLVHAP